MAAMYPPNGSTATMDMEARDGSSGKPKPRDGVRAYAGGMLDQNGRPAGPSKADRMSYSPLSPTLSFSADVRERLGNTVGNLLRQEFPPGVDVPDGDIARMRADISFLADRHRARLEADIRLLKDGGVAFKIRRSWWRLVSWLRRK